MGKSVCYSAKSKSGKKRAPSRGRGGERGGSDEHTRHWQQPDARRERHGVYKRAGCQNSMGVHHVCSCVSSKGAAHLQGPLARGSERPADANAWPGHVHTYMTVRARGTGYPGWSGKPTLPSLHDWLPGILASRDAVGGRRIAGSLALGGPEESCFPSAERLSHTLRVHRLGSASAGSEPRPGEND